MVKIMSLNDCFNYNPKIYFTESKYFGKYFYKAVIEIEKEKIEYGRRHKSSIKNSNISQLGFQLKIEIVNMFKVEDYRTRLEGGRLSFFSNNEKDLDKLCEIYKNRVKEITKPLNEKHINFLNDHKKVLVKSKYFLNKFKFKVHLNPYKMRPIRFGPVAEFLSTIDKESYATNYILNDFLNTYKKKHVGTLGWTIIVYLQNPEDLMMFQLKFNEDIIKIEEAVLLETFI